MSTNSNSTIGVAFIGGGLVAELHGRAVKACRNARLVGVHDLNAAKARATAKKFKGRAYTSQKELLEDPAVDVVHVLTPPEAHVQATQAALDAGMHVLVEKPVAHKAKDIKTIIRKAKSSGRLCVPAHNYIHVPSLREAKRHITEGKFGKISAFWMLYNMFHGKNLIAKYGSIYRVVCVHHAYSLLYLLGRPLRVVSMGMRGVHAQNLPEVGQASITCEMPDGALANLWASFACDDPTSDPWQVVYKVLGTKGGMSYSWNEAHYEDEGGPGFGMPGYVDSFRFEVDHFINGCVLNGEPPLSTMDDALDALRIIEAAERASKGRKAVEVAYD